MTKWKRQVVDLLGPDVGNRGRTASRALRRAVRAVLRPPTAVPARSLPLRRFQVNGLETFFGYYDISPFSDDGRRLLACAAAPSRRPAPGTPLHVGFFGLDGPTTFTPLGKTTTWNWQQGCRLRWHPAAPDEWVLYNTGEGGSYGAVALDIRTGRVVRRYTRPLYDVSKDGRWALSLDFGRLHQFRPGYGYSNFPEPPCGAQSNGIWRVDLETGRSDRILSVDTVKQLSPQPSMDLAQHYINHLSCSPSGERIFLLHLWLSGARSYSRIITAAPDGTALRLLAAEGHASHYAWRPDDHLLAYSTHASSGTHYHLYSPYDGSRKVVGVDALCADGHPSYRPDHGNQILTDTYPDRYGDRMLILYDDAKGARILGRFYSPPEYSSGPVRCDLHPRWDRDGGRVCIDSGHNGGRAMYVLSLGDVAPDHA